MNVVDLPADTQPPGTSAAGGWTPPGHGMCPKTWFSGLLGPANTRRCNPPWRATIALPRVRRAQQPTSGESEMSPYPTDHAGLEILPFDECLQLLASVPVGRVGFVADGEVVVLPVNHVVDGQDVIFRTAYGSKVAAAGGQDRTAFEADHYNEQNPVRMERAGQWPRRSGGCGGRHPALEPELEPSWRVSLGHRRAAPVLDPDPAHLGEWTTDPRDQVGIPPRRHVLPASRYGGLIPDPRHTRRSPGQPTAAVTRVGCQDKPTVRATRVGGNTQPHRHRGVLRRRHWTRAGADLALFAAGCHDRPLAAPA